MKTLVAVLAVVLFAFPYVSYGQVVATATATSEKVVSASGWVEVARTASGTFDVYVSPPSSANFASWRFWVTVPDAGDDIEIRRASDGQAIRRMSKETLRRGAWSPPMPVAVVYFSVVTAATPQVKLISWPEVSIATQTPVGLPTFDAVLTRTLPLSLRKLLPSVGLLSILRGKPEDAVDTSYTYCTTFLISPVHTVTAGHCVKGGLEGRYAKLVLGYDDPDRPEGRGEYNVSVVFDDKKLDLAVLELDRPADVDEFFAIAENEPGQGDELAILQHFLGEPLAISDDDECVMKLDRFDGPQVLENNRAVKIKEASFGHGCDTTVSSSGSPIITREGHLVVGMHQRGYSEGSPSINRGLRMKFLRDAIGPWAAQAAE